MSAANLAIGGRRHSPQRHARGSWSAGMGILESLQVKTEYRMTRSSSGPSAVGSEPDRIPPPRWGSPIGHLFGCLISFISFPMRSYLIITTNLFVWCLILCHSIVSFDSLKDSFRIRSCSIVDRESRLLVALHALWLVFIVSGVSLKRSSRFRVQLVHLLLISWVLDTIKDASMRVLEMSHTFVCENDCQQFGQVYWSVKCWGRHRERWADELFRGFTWVWNRSKNLLLSCIKWEYETNCPLFFPMAHVQHPSLLFPSWMLLSSMAVQHQRTRTF